MASRSACSCTGQLPGSNWVKCDQGIPEKDCIVLNETQDENKIKHCLMYILCIYNIFNNDK